MISIVVYGRNDNHGYNLHKRAAISLNCLAQLLRDDDDEIVFVDYNSDDNLPTFPEAIADTLTDQARAKLRILRARPRLHRRFAAGTTLAVLEPVARNIAVRRSNPANRWILSTNTDVILLPREKADLNDIVAALPGGFYHTPRFEIPESLWESFNRSDPDRIIEEVRILGRAARLNNVVYGSEVILYDGPGDFQLMERADLFAINGFDETMLHGWHVDSNIARRLMLQRGAPVASLIEQVFCYHCDHMRQATTVHRQQHVSNDPRRYVDDLLQPELPAQAAGWGCAAEEIEEIRLTADQAHRFRTAIGAAIAPLTEDFCEEAHKPATYDSYRYEPQNVVPFFADLLHCNPRDTRLAWCGLRLDTFTAVRRVWAELGFQRPIAVHPAAAPYLGAADGGPSEVVSRESWRAEADLFVFEFGRAGGGGASYPSDPGRIEPIDAEGLAVVHAAFLDAVNDEYSHISASPRPALRCFIGINCIHNRSEGIFAAHVASALTPFASHLRHGFVAAAAPEFEPEAALRLAIGTALGRAQPISGKELALARSLFDPLLGGAEPTPGMEHLVSINAVLGQAFLTIRGNPRNLMPPPEAVQRALAALEKLRPSAALASELGLPFIDRPPPPAERPLSRFAAWEDWDDPAWCAFAHGYATDPEANFVHRRDAVRWEQVHLLYGLDRSGMLRRRPQVLVFATMPDAIVAAISRLAERVEVFDLAAVAPKGRAPVFWAHGSAYDPAALKVFEPGTRIEQLDPDAYDVILFPHGAMFGGGIESAIAWLRVADRLLRPGGILVFKSEIVGGPITHPVFFDRGYLAEDGFAFQLSRYTPFRVEGGFDPLLSRATADRVPPEKGPAASNAYFLTRLDGRVLVPALWFLRKDPIAGESSWDRLRDWARTRRLGEQIATLQIGAAGLREEGGIISTRPKERGHVFYGPYLRALSGRYRATISVAASDSEKNRGIADAFIEAVIDGETVAAQFLKPEHLRSGVVTLDFEIKAAGRTGGEPVLELRFFSPGAVAVRVDSVVLQLCEAGAAPAWPPLPRSGTTNGRGTHVDHEPPPRAGSELRIA